MAQECSRSQRAWLRRALKAFPKVPKVRVSAFWPVCMRMLNFACFPDRFQRFINCLGRWNRLLALRWRRPGTGATAEQRLYDLAFRGLHVNVADHRIDCDSVPALSCSPAPLFNDGAGPKNGPFKCPGRVRTSAKQVPTGVPQASAAGSVGYCAEVRNRMGGISGSRVAR